MPTCTPVYGLDYPIGSDRPCDVNDTFCSMMAAVDTNLTRLDGIVDRVADSIPMARVRITVPVIVNSGTTIGLPFDTVDVDTDDMIDLTADPSAIRLPFPGIYSCAFQIQVASVLSSDQISATLGSASDIWLNDGTGTSYLNSAAPSRFTSVAAPINLNFFCGNVFPTYAVTSATATVYWLRDL